MTATLTENVTVGAPRVSVVRGYRFELVKLLSQWRIRLVILACWIAPALFVAAEFSFVTVDRNQVDQAAAAGDQRAHTCQVE